MDKALAGDFSWSTNAIKTHPLKCYKHWKLIFEMLLSFVYNNLIEIHEKYNFF